MLKHNQGILPKIHEVKKHNQKYVLCVGVKIIHSTTKSTTIQRWTFYIWTF